MSVNGQRKVVITGIGAVTPLGNDWRSTWEGAVAGRSGIDFIQSVPAAQIDAKLGEIVEKAFHASRTALGHAKRLLHASFHADPRDMIEEIVRAQQDCMDSWEIEAANRAWDARREARFYPPPSRDR